MRCAEDYIKFCVRRVMERNSADLEFFDKIVEKGLIDRLENILAEPFAKCSYTEAIKILTKEQKEHPEKTNFVETDIHWGMDLASEHERYITEKIFKKPTIVYNYPAAIKSFYMRANEDGKTVAAMDILCCYGFPVFIGPHVEGLDR